MRVVTAEVDADKANAALTAARLAMGQFAEQLESQVASSGDMPVADVAKLAGKVRKLIG